MNPREVTPNAWLLAFIAGTASALGSTPYLLFVGALWIVPLLAVGAAITMWVYASRLTTRASMAPTAGEWVTAGWGMVGYATFVSFALVYYAIAYWFVRLVILILGLVKVEIDTWWATLAGLVVSGFVGFGLYVASLQTAIKLPQRLYPRLAGVRSPYYALWHTHRWLIVAAVAAGLSSVVAIVVLDAREWYWVLGCSALLGYSGMPVATVGDTRERRRDRGLEAVRLMMEAVGWTLNPLDATGDPEIDPFTIEIDFIARRDDRSLLVEVVAARVDWTVASGLQTAAHVLGARLNVPDDGMEALRPLLVLLSDEIDDSVRRFADIENFDVAHVPESAVREVLDAKNDGQRLTELAHELIFEAGVPHG